jgi:hypothetical protein
MNQTFGHDELAENNAMDSAAQNARQPWVKPALERLDLKDALSVAGGGDDGISGS